MEFTVYTGLYQNKLHIFILISINPLIRIDNIHCFPGCLLTAQEQENVEGTVTADNSHADVGIKLTLNGFSLYIIHGFFEGNKNKLPYTGQALHRRNLASTAAIRPQSAGHYDEIMLNIRLLCSV